MLFLFPQDDRSIQTRMLMDPRATTRSTRSVNHWLNKKVQIHPSFFTKIDTNREIRSASTPWSMMMTMMMSSSNDCGSRQQQRNHPNGQRHCYGSIPTAVGVYNDDNDELVENHTDYNDLRTKQRRPAVLAVIVVVVALVGILAGGGGTSHRQSDVIMNDNNIADSSVHNIELLRASKDKKKAKKNHTNKKNKLLQPKHDNKPLYFDQKVDHVINPTNSTATFAHRYYKSSKHFKGPGHPLFVILGGEDALEGLLYPFVYERMAKKMGAFVLSPEHRFYGTSLPIKTKKKEQLSVQQLTELMTPDQALLDTVALIQHVREKLGCSLDRTSPKYCPVISVGGSYPGFLSAMLRFVYPDYVDISYASSAPLMLYSQQADPNGYYDKITHVTEAASPECPSAIRSTLEALKEELLSLSDKVDIKDLAASIGFCPDKLPQYLQDVETLVSEGIVFLVPAIFADFNMAYYPPGPDTALERACHIFLNAKHSPFEKFGKFMDLRGEVEYGEDKPKCFDMNLELPSGHHARIMGSDWSGSGGGFTGEIWEFQCCKDLIIRTGYSNESMFIPRQWTYEWHNKHCQDRFPGVPVGPTRMVNQWGFNDLSHASRILFVNGLNDGWAASSHLEDVVPGSVVAVNLPNGAHHSDLSHTYPNEKDTEDVLAGLDTIETILTQWLAELKQVDTP